MANGRAVGIGGVFFKAADSDALQKWYVEKLGLPEEDGNVCFTCDGEAAGAQTVFATFERDSDYFGNSGQTFMLNFRVDDLDALLARLQADGVTIVPDRGDYDYGRFAWILDPEGNRVELWEPKE